jgi:hypothetical protein
MKKNLKIQIWKFAISPYQRNNIQWFLGFGDAYMEISFCTVGKKKKIAATNHLLQLQANENLSA